MQNESFNSINPTLFWHGGRKSIAKLKSSYSVVLCLSSSRKKNANCLKCTWNREGGAKKFKMALATRVPSKPSS